MTPRQPVSDQSTVFSGQWRRCQLRRIV